MKADFDSVIPSAILNAYSRTKTDIKYANEIFKELSKEGISSDLMVDKISPELEARYKLIDKLLIASNIKQVIDLGSGYSPRGLIFTENSDFKYSELDLDKVVNNKIKILNSIKNIPDNLKIISGNVLNKADFDKCVRFFDEDKKVAVINEGLLRYLSFEEKREVALNVKGILNRFGGVWITSDATPKKFVLNQDINIDKFNINLSERISRNNSNWRFEDIDHVKSFFGELGFEIEVHNFSKVNNLLTSPKVLGYDDIEVNKLLEDAIVVIMRLKD